MGDCIQFCVQPVPLAAIDALASQDFYGDGSHVLGAAFSTDSAATLSGFFCRESERRAFTLAANAIREEEKARVARELHDELAQSLCALKMDTLWVRDHAADAPQAVVARLAQMLAMIDRTVTATRRIAADLLATARNEVPHLYANWQVLSLARLASDGEIEVQATDVERVVFGKSESFFRQLAQLDVLLDFVQAHPEKPLREINLAVARVTDGYSQVPVALDLPDRASPSRPPPAATTPSPLPLFNLQKKTPREF